MTLQDSPGSWTAAEVDPATTVDPAILGSTGPLPFDGIAVDGIAADPTDRPARWYRTSPARLLGQASAVVAAALLVGLMVFLVVRQLAASDTDDEILRGGPVDTIAIQPMPDEGESAPPNSSRSGSRRSEADGDSPSVLPLGDVDADGRADRDGPGNGTGSDGSSTASASDQNGRDRDDGRPASFTASGSAATSGVTILNASTATTGGPGSTAPAGASRTTSTTGRSISTIGRTTSVTSAVNTSGTRSISTTTVAVSTTTVSSAPRSSTTGSSTPRSSTTRPTIPSTSAPTTTSTAPTTSAPKFPEELISLPADSSVHRWDAVTRIRANRVPGATSYCWTVIAGNEAAQCRSDRDYELAAGQLRPGPTVIVVEAQDSTGAVLMTQQISISRLVGDLIEQPDDGFTFDPDDRVRLRANDVAGADNYCWVMTQGTYSSGELCSVTGRHTLRPGHIIRRTLERGPVTVQARAYRGSVLIGRQTITVTIEK